MEIIKSSDNQLSDTNLNSSNNKIDFPNLIENKIDCNILPTKIFFYFFFLNLDFPLLFLLL